MFWTGGENVLVWGQKSHNMNTNTLSENQEAFLQRFSMNQGEIKIINNAISETGLAVADQAHIRDTFTVENLTVYMSLRGSAPAEAARYLRELAPQKQAVGLIGWLKGLFV